MQKKRKGSTTPKANGKSSPSTGKKKNQKSIPKNRRNSTTHPNLDKTYNLKSRTKLYDQDYLHKLNDKELAWLNRFNAEYINAGRELQENKPLHRTKALKKDCYDRNNARNRDILTQQEAMGRIRNLDEELKVNLNPIKDLEIIIDLKSGGFIDEDGRILDKKYKKPIKE